jgi:ketosteroid isomerase-like protein
MRAMDDAVSRHDLHGFVDLMHPDAVWEHNPGSGSPEEGVYVGREEIMALFERIFEGWEYMRPEPSEVQEPDPGVLVVRGRLHTKHSSTENEIVSPYEQRLEIRDGLLSKGRMVIGLASLE